MKFAILFLVFGSVFFVFGQESETNVQNVSTDIVFQEIMQALPEDMKMKVDSAGAMGGTHDIINNAIHDSVSRTKLSEKSLRKTEKLDELPDAVKKQVEKTIADMEERSHNRRTQFKEYQRLRENQKKQNK